PGASRCRYHALRPPTRPDPGPAHRRHDFRTRRDGHSHVVARSELHYRFAQHRHSYDPQRRVAPGRVLISNREGWHNDMNGIDATLNGRLWAVGFPYNSAVVQRTLVV